MQSTQESTTEIASKAVEVAQAMSTKDILNQALLSTLEAAKAGKDFVLEQAPDVIQQFLVWKATEAGFWMVAGFSLIAFTIWSLKKRWVQWYTFETYNSMEVSPTILLALLNILAGIVVFILHVLDFLKIVLAPKVYLLEFASSLVK